MANADHPGWPAETVADGDPDAGGRLYILADTDTRGRSWRAWASSNWR